MKIYMYLIVIALGSLNKSLQGHERSTFQITEPIEIFESMIDSPWTIRQEDT